MEQEQPPLLTDEQIEKLAAMASALRSIADNHQPHLRDNLSDEIDRLRAMVLESAPKETIRELAEKLNAGTVLMDWAMAIHDDESVLEELVLNLADENIDESAEDEDADADEGNEDDAGDH